MKMLMFTLISFQLFTEYGRLALEANDNESKPFQVWFQIKIPIMGKHTYVLL